MVSIICNDQLVFQYFKSTLKILYFARLSSRINLYTLVVQWIEQVPPKH